MNPAVDEVAAVVQEQVLDAEVLLVGVDLPTAVSAQRDLLSHLGPLVMRHVLPPSAGIASSDQSPARSTRPPGP